MGCNVSGRKNLNFDKVGKFRHSQVWPLRFDVFLFSFSGAGV